MIRWTWAVAAGSLWAGQASAVGTCPAWLTSQSVPACPAGGSTILPENYPATALVVSDRSVGSSSSADDFAPAFVEQALLAAGDQVPLILLPVRESTFARITERVAALAARPGNARFRERWAQALVRVPDAPSFTWQQDYFESFVDPASGMPTPTRIRGYAQAGDSFSALSGAMATSGACYRSGGGPAPARTIPPTTRAFHVPQDVGTMGGNIEGLPGGLCLHGNNQAWEGFAEHYCGSRDNQVVIDVSWLAVGHADELVQTIRRPGVDPPCDFALLVPSPARALEALRSEPNAKFAELYFNPGTVSTEIAWSERARTPPFRDACRIAWRGKNAVLFSPGAPDIVPPPGSVPATALLDLLVRPAGAAVPNRPGDCNRSDGVLGLTNKDLQVAFEALDNLAIINAVVQAKMNNLKAQLKARIRSRLPSCPVEFVDVPTLYQGGHPILLPNTEGLPIDQQYSLPNGMVEPLLPSPVNSVSLGDRVLAPHPQNGAFARAFDRSLKALGTRSSFVDTFEYAHLGTGNLHCATHSLRFCRPDSGGEARRDR